MTWEFLSFIDLRPAKLATETCKPNADEVLAWSHLTTAIARPAARDESSARRAIAQPAPSGVNDHRAPVAAG